jgi:hypothetical protein
MIYISIVKIFRSYTESCKCKCSLFCFTITEIDEMPSSMSIVMNNVLVDIAITTSIHISVCICCEVVESTIIDPSWEGSVT